MLADALAGQLDAVVPNGVSVSAVTCGSVRIAVGQSAVEVLPLWTEEPADSFARNVLKNLQDVVIESVTGGRAWPHSAEYVAAHRLPEADAAIVNGLLHCWYGDP